MPHVSHSSLATWPLECAERLWGSWEVEPFKRPKDLRKCLCTRTFLHAEQCNFLCAGARVGTGRDNYFMACTVHEKIKVFEMSYTHLRCSRPCIATCFAHSVAVRPPSFTWRVCGFSESHDLECAHGPAQVAVSKGELACYRSQFPGGLGRGVEEVASPWPAPQAEVEFGEPCCRLTAI